LRGDVETERRRGQAVAIREIARAVGQELTPTDDAGAPDELREVERDVGGRADLEVGPRALRGDSRPWDDGVACGSQVLVEAAHAPAVRELHDAPLVAVACAPTVLVPAEVLDAPLAIDPADLAVDGLARVAPRELAAHAEPALEVRERRSEAE